jgi:hypothetical protein
MTCVLFILSGLYPFAVWVLPAGIPFMHLRNANNDECCHFKHFFASLLLFCFSYFLPML